MKIALKEVKENHKGDYELNTIYFTVFFILSIISINLLKYYHIFIMLFFIFISLLSLIFSLIIIKIK